MAEGPHQELAAEIRRGARVISISGLVSEPARALALAALQRDTGKSFAIVTQSNRDLEGLGKGPALLVLRASRQGRL